MDYYTERNGMRSTIAKTSIITIEMYSLLLDCCTRHYDHIAWKFPLDCPDGNGCCGIDDDKFSIFLKFEIPTLFRDTSGQVKVPEADPFSSEDSYDQYALFDLIELVAKYWRDILRKSLHSFFHHYDLEFSSTKDALNVFREEINAIFTKTGLLYTFTTSGKIERVEETGVLNNQIEQIIKQAPEPELKKLIQDAITRHKDPHPSPHRDAVEKIWDAFERLKSYYTTLNKAKSATKIVEDMANQQNNFVNLFNDEFRILTEIGNNFRIRHHETNRIDITDDKHIDYFFNRCLSLVALAIQYLK